MHVVVVALVAVESKYALVFVDFMYDFYLTERLPSVRMETCRHREDTDLTGCWKDRGFPSNEKQPGTVGLESG